MKRNFLKVLPFAAALLLATSCSKDDNNSTDEIVNNGGEQIETVVKNFKTLTVKGKVNKSISKVTVEQNTLVFEGNEVFTFGNSNDDVYGTITFTNADGSYEAIINYASEEALSGNFIASLGSNPAIISDAYADLTEAVQHAYFTINFTISQVEGEYKLRSGETDLVVNLQSAFIKALSAATTKLDNDKITVAADKYYVVPVGKTMGNSGQNTIAGKIYSLEKKIGEFSVAAKTKIIFSSGKLLKNNSTGAYKFADNQFTYSEEGYTSTFTFNDIDNWNKQQFDGVEWVAPTQASLNYLLTQRKNATNLFNSWVTINGVSGMIILPDDYNTETTIEWTDWNTLETDGAVFLPAGGNWGAYWTWTIANNDYSIYLNFTPTETASASNGYYRNQPLSVRLVHYFTVE